MTVITDRTASLIASAYVAAFGRSSNVRRNRDQVMVDHGISADDTKAWSRVQGILELRASRFHRQFGGDPLFRARTSRPDRAYALRLKRGIEEQPKS